MGHIDAEAAGIARMVRAALRTELDRREAQIRAAMLSSGSTRNPVARRRMLERMRRADPHLFLAVDQAERARDVNIVLAWFVVTQDPVRLAVGSMTIEGSVRTRDVQCYPNFSLRLSEHGQIRLVRRLRLHTLPGQLAALRCAWTAMTSSIVATQHRFVRDHGRPIDAEDLPAIGTGRHFHVPLQPPHAGPAGLATVAFDHLYEGEIVTALDADLLDDDQEAILRRWSTGPTPLLGEIEARSRAAAPA